jgi:MerR family transcriptional regulator, redox-sensitive transcriptional activator SoxR
MQVKVDLMSSETIAIGEVARLSGKAPSAIRYYETVDLIDEPARVSGKRRYPRDVVRKLAVIETAQRAGLTLDEIRRLLRAAADDPDSVERLREVAATRLPVLTEAIARAELVRSWLEAAADCCCPSLDDCPLFDDPTRMPERSLSLT